MQDMKLRAWIVEETAGSLYSAECGRIVVLKLEEGKCGLRYRKDSW